MKPRIIEFSVLKILQAFIRKFTNIRQLNYGTVNVISNDPPLKKITASPIYKGTL